jgi:hypothetical protein
MKLRLYHVAVGPDFGPNAPKSDAKQRKPLQV